MTSAIRNDFLNEITGNRIETLRVAGEPLPAAFVPGRVYASAHIRLNTPSYNPGNRVVGFQSDGDRERFERETARSLEPLSLFVDGCRASTTGEYPESLYLHPDDFSGLISLSRLEHVLAAMDVNAVSSVRWVDIYAFPEEIDEPEKRKRLAYYDEQISEHILRACDTGSRRKYRAPTILDKDGAERRFPGLQFIENFTSGQGCPVYASYMQGVVDRLVANGVLLMAEQAGHRFYRTALKTELSKFKKAQRGPDWMIASKVLWEE